MERGMGRRRPHLRGVIADVDIAVLAVLDDEHLPVDGARLLDENLLISAVSDERGMSYHADALSGIEDGAASAPTSFFLLENIKSFGSGFFLFQLNSCAAGLAAVAVDAAAGLAAAAAAGFAMAAAAVLLTVSGAAVFDSIFAFFCCVPMPQKRQGGVEGRG